VQIQAADAEVAGKTIRTLLLSFVVPEAGRSGSPCQRSLFHPSPAIEQNCPAGRRGNCFYKAQFRDGSDLPVSLRAQPPQLLQALQAPQQAQLPPQALFPAFLSRIMLRISSTTITAIAAMRTIFTRLAESQLSMVSLPL
jgi:hypothetical protein